MTDGAPAFLEAWTVAHGRLAAAQTVRATTRSVREGLATDCVWAGRIDDTAMTGRMRLVQDAVAADVELLRVDGVTWIRPDAGCTLRSFAKIAALARGRWVEDRADEMRLSRAGVGGAVRRLVDGWTPAALADMADAVGEAVVHEGRDAYAYTQDSVAAADGRSVRIVVSADGDLMIVEVGEGGSAAFADWNGVETPLPPHPDDTVTVDELRREEREAKARGEGPAD